MELFHSPAQIPDGYGPAVVAIGKFDGVHTGHRAVIDQARADAAEDGARVVAVTFDRHPLALLNPELCPPSLTGLTQKERLLAETGIDAALVLPFDERLASLEPAAFVDEVLMPLGVRTVLVGADFRFGHRAAGTPQLLAELGAQRGFRVEVHGEVRDPVNGERVSSTRIRQALDDGDIVTATRMLGHAPAVWGQVVHGLKRGRELGFPTANLSPDLEGFVPADGVYAGWLILGIDTDGARTRYPAAISVGTNPTFDDVHLRQVEAYVLDETELDLYDRFVEVAFVARVRGMVAFQGVDALIAQIADDVEKVRQLLS